MRFGLCKHWAPASLLTLGLLVGCGQETAPESDLPPRLVKALRIADTSALTERTFPGRASATREVNLSFRVSGPLIGLPVKVGDEVKTGDELARIDPRDFEVKIETIRGKLEQAKATRRVAEREHGRAIEIQKKDKGLISRSEVDKRLGARDAARSNVKSLESALTSAQDDLGYSHLKAPFDGVVVATYVDNFEDVLPKRPVLRLLDPSSIEMVISVPDGLIGYAPYVESVSVRFDALPDTEIKAEVKEIGREASQATRTYPVTLIMGQPEEGEILPGMAGQASVLSRPPEDSALVGIEIPATALFPGDDPNQNFVWIVDQATKTLSRREVQIGKLARFGVLIREGLKPGEWIVVKGVNSVKEGQAVRILDVAREEQAR